MEQSTFKGKGVLKWALTIGIAIILNLFFAVAIQTVYPEPKFDSFCKQEQVQNPAVTEASCVAIGGQWNAYNPSRVKDLNDPTGYCNEHFTCSQNYQDARENYSQNVFITLVVLGALAFVAGYLLRISPAVSAGLSYGGVLTLIIASIRYWGEAGDFGRLAIVSLALIALIVVGVKKFKE